LRMKFKVFLKAKNKGFTLIELLVALAVLVMAAAAFVPALSFLAKSNRANKIKMTASSIAAGVVEEIRALPYDEIGTENGNPPGTIPQISSIMLSGVRYDVETRISWGSAKSSVSGAENVVAVKNIQVTVSAPGAFSGTVEKIGEIYSTASRDSEEPLTKNGHIRVKLKDSGDMPLGCVTIVSLTGEPPVSLSQVMTTDSGGEVLFGVLDAGEYTVRVKPPDGFAAGPGHRVDGGGWIVVEDVEVNDYQVTEVSVYMDEISEFCRISVRLVDSEDTEGPEIIIEGTMTLNWQGESSSINLVDNKRFSKDDFIDGALPYGFFGTLWSSGVYNIVITDVPGYNDYDMSLGAPGKPLLPDGTEWDGTMQMPGQSLEVRVPLEAKTSGRFYREDTREDFEDASLIENLAVTEDGLLVLGENQAEIDLVPILELPAQVSASSAAGSHPAWHICDRDEDTYWRENRIFGDSWVEWDFRMDGAVSRTEILAKESSGSSTEPRGFRLQYSDNGTNWVTLYSGELDDGNDNYQVINIDNPQKARYFRLLITSRYGSWFVYAAVNEVRLIGSAGYAQEGARISRGIPLNWPRFASAPRFTISWQAGAAAGTSVRVFTAVTDNAAIPDESEFTEVANGGFIPGIAEGSDIRGKYLWVMEKLETGDIMSTPSLDWLEINY
jgi:prepilin-type N-terminal cleavage/methylation domain-containing protein